MEHGFVVWEDRYNLGHPLIDRQHQQIIEMFNDLYESRFHKNEGLVTGEVIDRMARYVRDHFSSEESLMVSVGYPRLEEHRREHRFFVDESRRLSVMRDEPGIDSEHLLVFLKDWLLKHIAESDKKIVPYLKK